jgi:ribosomal protein S18 acetylase RimI-like enzyme
VRAVVTRVPYEGFNAVVSSAPGPVEAAFDFVERANVPLLWHVWPGARSVEPLLLARGFSFYEEEPAMVAAPDGGLPGPPPRLAITPVTDVGELALWVRILTGSSDAGFVDGVVALRRAAGFAHLLGRVDGEAVATAAVFTGSAAGEVQHVVTRRDHRRRGIGTAMTAAALRLVREQGHRQAVLTASPDGVRIYERLGFRRVADVRRFLRRCYADAPE